MIPIRCAPAASPHGRARPAGPADPSSGPHRLLHAPHRLLFFAGVLGLLASGAWWAAVLAARVAGVAWPSVVAPAQLHATLMLHGFMPFFFWGFLFTAGPKWLKVAPPSARSLAAPAAVALLAVAAMPVAASLSVAALAAAATALAACWLAFALRFARLLVASPAADVAHPAVVLVAGGLGAVSPIAFAVGLATGSAGLGRASVALGLWGFCVPVFVTVAHRMLPFFSAGVPGRFEARHPAWLLGPLVGGAWLHGVADLLGRPALRGAVDAALAALLVGLAVRWAVVHRVRSQRLLAMLHVGFAWLGAAFALYAADAATVAADGHGLGLAPLHALTIGGFGSLVLAMVTRVSCGQAGRPASGDRATARLFVVFQAAAVLRIAAELQSSPGASAWLSVAAVAVWLGAFGVWAARYLPVYLGPRADGRPG